MNAPSLPQILPLSGRVRNYSWGGRHFLADLLGKTNPERRPWAEYWLGAHPAAPSSVRLPGKKRRLDALVRQFPKAILGRELASRGDEWPFLFKILDVASPLSIQLHPDREQAEAGFARENAAGLDPDAPQRSFRDPRPKAEFLLALDEFWLLHGFRPEHELAEMLTALPGMQGLADTLAAGGVRALVATALRMPRARVKTTLDALHAHALSLPEVHRNDRARPWPWLLDRYPAHATGDRQQVDPGLLFFFLMRIVRLTAGQGLLTRPGQLHAYLRGPAVELMNNSDNTLRAGLTAKHTDPELLLEHLALDNDGAFIRYGHRDGPVTTFDLPLPDFALSCYRLNAGASHCIEPERGPSLLFVLDGKLRLNDDLSLGRGRAVCIRPETEVNLVSHTAGQIAHARLGRAAARP